MRSSKLLCFSVFVFCSGMGVVAAQSSATFTVTTQSTGKGNSASIQPNSARYMASGASQARAGTALVEASLDTTTTRAVAPSVDPRTVIETKNKPSETSHERLHTTTLLPDGMDQNPPDEDAIVKDGLSWKGEYELDKNEQVLIDSNGRAVPVLYTSKGKMVRPKNVKLAGKHPATILNGVMLIDGWPGKGRLNYAVQDLKFLYFSVPGIGTLIVSPAPFAGAREEKNAFNGNLLAVRAGEHDLQLETEKPILGRGSEAAWVKLDAGYVADNRFPVMGYGLQSGAPYMWPGAVKAAAMQGSLNAPALPLSMRPKMVSAPCPAERICAEALR